MLRLRVIRLAIESGRMCVQGVINSKFRKKNEWMRSKESFEKSYYELEYILSLDFIAPQRNT